MRFGTLTLYMEYWSSISAELLRKFNQVMNSWMGRTLLLTFALHQWLEWHCCDFHHIACSKALRRLECLVQVNSCNHQVCYRAGPMDTKTVLSSPSSHMISSVLLEHLSNKMINEIQSTISYTILTHRVFWSVGVYVSPRQRSNLSRQKIYGLKLNVSIISDEWFSLNILNFFFGRTWFTSSTIHRKDSTIFFPSSHLLSLSICA